jgi:hypothetical protein
LDAAFFYEELTASGPSQQSSARSEKQSSARVLAQSREIDARQCGM